MKTGEKKIYDGNDAVKNTNFQIYWFLFQFTSKVFMRCIETPPYFSSIVYNFTLNNGQKIDGTVVGYGVYCKCIEFTALYNHTLVDMLCDAAKRKKFVSIYTHI